MESHQRKTLYPAKAASPLHQIFQTDFYNPLPTLPFKFFSSFIACLHPIKKHKILIVKNCGILRNEKQSRRTVMYLTGLSALRLCICLFDDGYFYGFNPHTCINVHLIFAQNILPGMIQQLLYSYRILLVKMPACKACGHLLKIIQTALQFFCKFSNMYAVNKRMMNLHGKRHHYLSIFLIEFSPVE